MEKLLSWMVKLLHGRMRQTAPLARVVWARPASLSEIGSLGSLAVMMNTFLSRCRYCKNPAAITAEPGVILQTIAHAAISRLKVKSQKVISKKRKLNGKA